MEYPREQLEQIFLQLPANLKLALFSEINAVLIRQIAEKFHLPHEKIPLLAGQIGLVILGVLPPQNLSSELKTVLNIDGQMSQAITQEVNFKIFTPIRLSLRKLYGLATPEEISMEQLAPAPISAPKPIISPPIPTSVSPPVQPSPSPLPTKTQAPIPTSRPTAPPPTVAPPKPATAQIIEKTQISTPPSRPAAPPPTAIPPKPTITPPIGGIPPTSRPPVSPPVNVPRPFIPPRPLTTPPGIIVPKTITPPSLTHQRPAYESPALIPKPIIPPPPSPSATSATSGTMTKPIAPPPIKTVEHKPSLNESRPITPSQKTEPTITEKSKIPVPVESIDLSKININDSQLKGKIVDLKNLE